MSKSASLPYRPCVGIALFNRNKQVWIGRRIPKWEKDGRDGQHLWQMPQGGIDEGETPDAAAFRELEEEIGTRNASVIARTKGWLSYDLPAEALGTALRGRYRGQKQKWFAMSFNGNDSEINIAPEKGEKPEFDEWRWETLEHLPDLVIPFKREVYVQVVAAFQHLTE